jgi:D-alanine--D-alanine ligase
LDIGHRVVMCDAHDVLMVLSMVKSFQPEMVLNTAEAHRGDCREALYPSIFEEMCIPYTGPDPWTASVTMDKHLSKILVDRYGILVPDGVLIEKDSKGIKESGRVPSKNVRSSDDMMKWPRIVKPNMEGSSKGITSKSIVNSHKEMLEVAEGLIDRFGGNVIAEEFILGRDVAVPFVEGMGGVLDPVEYSYEGGKEIYDYELKNDPDKVHLKIVDPREFRALKLFAGKVASVLRLRDIARIDFRVSRTGVPYFLEANAIPALTSESSIFFSAAKSGTDFKGVLGFVLATALLRRDSKAQGRG